MMQQIMNFFLKVNWTSFVYQEKWIVNLSDDDLVRIIITKAFDYMYHLLSLDFR